MFKMPLLLVLLLFAAPLHAQYAPVRYLERDSLVRPTLSEIYERPQNLADTLKNPVCRCDYEREWRETPRPDGGVDVVFTLRDCNAYDRSVYYFFPVVLQRPMADGIRFEADWAVGFDRDEDPSLFLGQPMWDELDIYVRQDTVITDTFAFESGGVTSEGETFRFTGPAVERIEARTKFVYNAGEQIEALTQPDGWSEHIEDIASPWIDSRSGRCSYRLPLAERLTIDPATFHRLKRAAIAIQRRYLIEKRDSVIAAVVAGGGRNEWVVRKLDAWQARLKPDFESAATLGELNIYLEIKYLLTEVTVFLHDGQKRRFVHVASYTASIP